MNIEKVVKGLENVIAAVKEQGPAPAIVESGRFRILSDGWVLDKAIGIEWGPSSTKKMDWEEAKKYAAEKGGRLPTVRELRSLIDYDKHNPAIDTQFFGDTKTDDWYWTATEVAGGAGFAWCVGFSYGYVGNDDEGGDNYVRPCRASQGIDVLTF